VAIDKSGNVLVTGRFEGSVDFGQGSMASDGGRDVYDVGIDRLGGRCEPGVIFPHTP